MTRKMLSNSNSNDPDYRKAISDGLRKAWENPEYRDKVTKSSTGRLHSEETKNCPR